MKKKVRIQWSALLYSDEKKVWKQSLENGGIKHTSNGTLEKENGKRQFFQWLMAKDTDLKNINIQYEETQQDKEKNLKKQLLRKHRLQK